MAIANNPPTKRRQERAEAAMLKAAAELHPTWLPASELIPRVVGNSDDPGEVRAAFAALGRLREYGVIADRGDDLVQLTPTALRAVALLAGPGGRAPGNDDGVGRRDDES